MDNLRERVKARAQWQCEAETIEGEQCLEVGSQCIPHGAGAPTISTLTWLCNTHAKRERTSA